VFESYLYELRRRGIPVNFEVNFCSIKGHHSSAEPKCLINRSKTNKTFEDVEGQGADFESPPKDVLEERLLKPRKVNPYQFLIRVHVGVLFYFAP
jgi:hypothetical protein